MTDFQGSHRNSKTQFHDFSMIFHDQQCNFHDYLICNFHDYLMHILQPPLLAASVRQLVFWLPVVLSYYVTKFHDFSMTIQGFSNSMIFPCMELFLVIFQVFHDFQSLWEPWTLSFLSMSLPVHPRLPRGEAFSFTPFILMNAV